MRWTALLALPMMMSLTACASLGSEVVVKIICPINVAYDADTQTRALTEYEALPKGSALRLFVGDYKRQRDQNTVCRERGIVSK